MIASLDIASGPPPKSGSDAVMAGGETGAEAVGMADFALLVDSFTPIGAPVVAQGTTGPATVGNTLPPTGNSLPGLPVSQGLEPLARSAPDTPEPDTAPPSRDELAQAALARFARTNPATGETVTAATDRLAPEKPAPAPTPPPADRLEAIRQIMSPELRAVIDRAASVMVQRLGGVSDGGADKAASPAIRTEATASILQAAPMVAAPEGAPTLQLGTLSTAAPTTGAPTTQATAAAPAPHDFQAVVERLGEAREAAQTGRASLAVRHEDFGQVSLRLEAAAAGIKFALTSTDPDFAPVAQAALAERVAAERTPIERAERAPQADAGAGNSLGQSAPDNARQEAQNRSPTIWQNGAGAEFTADGAEQSDHQSSAPKPPRDGALYA